MVGWGGVGWGVVWCGGVGWSTSLQSLSQFMGTSSGFNPRTNSDMTSLGDQIQPYTGSSLDPSVPPFVSNSGTGDKIEHTKGKTKANKGSKLLIKLIMRSNLNFQNIRTMSLKQKYVTRRLQLKT